MLRVCGVIGTITPTKNKPKPWTGRFRQKAPTNLHNDTPVSGINPQNKQLQEEVTFVFFFTYLIIITVTILIYAVGYRGPINAVFCTVCILLMWFESAFGICWGCKIYYGLIKLKVIKEPKVVPACPGGVCPISIKKTK